jgi:hypothetical protein
VKDGLRLRQGYGAHVEMARYSTNILGNILGILGILGGTVIILGFVSGDFL